MRPYVLTGGRVPDDDDVRLDTLVHAAAAADHAPSLSTEQRAILAGLAGSYLTVAEVASQLRLPLGVAQVLVADLVRLGALRVHDAGLPSLDPSGGGASQEERYLVLDVLESLYDGISSL
ncbi:DUF742 domain-containing protein [Cellulomonas pakistanensis]|uniref:DUF742 domain-containing protein n=1 Tax=Cellulomonas pakistanensis TaxID=992287 RepID=UPI0019418BCC|nr:DUF742 domain-containing protein [Cellulomonas pakistanensis]